MNVAGDGDGAAHVRPAGREDVGLLLEMIHELADYEKLADRVTATEGLLERALFGESPAAGALIAQAGGRAAGYAIWFPTFSTFLAIQGVWLEDLYVRPDARGAGVGRALLSAVARAARERGAERLEWSALDWNELALGFYKTIGAEQMNDWITHRLVGHELEALAAESAS